MVAASQKPLSDSAPSCHPSLEPREVIARNGVALGLVQKAGMVKGGLAFFRAGDLSLNRHRARHLASHPELDIGWRYRVQRYPGTTSILDRRTLTSAYIARQSSVIQFRSIRLSLRNFGICDRSCRSLYYR